MTKIFVLILLTLLSSTVTNSVAQSTSPQVSQTWFRNPSGFRAQLHPRTQQVLVFGQNSVSTYNSTNGTMIRNYYAGERTVLSATYSPDGQSLAISMDDGNIYIYNTTSGVKDETISYGENPTLDVAWSNDGALLALSSYDSVRFYNLEQKRFIHSIFTNGISAVQWKPRSSDECVIVTFSLQNFSSKALYYDIKNRVVLSRFGDSSIVNAQWSSDGKYIAGLSLTGEVNVWNMNTEQLVTHISPPAPGANDITNICWQNPLTLLYSSGNVVRSYIVPQGTIHQFALTRDYPIAGIAVNEQTNYLLLTSLNDIIEPASQTNPPVSGVRIKGHGDAVAGVVFTGISSGVSAGSQSVQLYTNRGDIQYTYPHGQRVANGVVKHPSRGYVAVGYGLPDDLNGEVRLINTATNQAISLLGRIAAFHPNGNALVTFDGDKKFRVFSMNDFTQTDSVETSMNIVVMKYDPTGTYLMVRTDDGRALVLDDKFEQALSLSNLVDDNSINQLEYLVNQNIAVVLHRNRRMIQGYSTVTENALRFTIEFDNKIPTAISAQTRGDILAIGFENGIIQFYDTKTQRVIAETNFGYTVSALAWNSEDSQLMVGGVGGAVAKYSISGISSVEERAESQLLLYPNPTKDIVIINDNSVAPSERYVVTNLIGEVIQTGSFERGLAINTSNWNKGAYMIRIGKRTTILIKD
jgi:WD40 repeat protein